MPKAQLTDGLRLHYQRVGTGPELVMIHGLTGNLAVWHLRIIPDLLDSFRILSYDLRGHGYSDMPPTGYSADAMADDLLQLLDHLEIERALLVGHSYGADIALYTALLHPERVDQVIAIEAALPAMVSERNRDEWGGWDHWVETLARSGTEVPPEHRSDVRWLLRASLELPKKWGPLNGLPRNAKHYLKLLDETTLVDDYEHVGRLPLDRIGDIDVPVVLMYAEDSAFLNTHDYLQEHLPKSRSILLPQTEWGHFGPLEQPEIVAAHIRAAAQR